MTFQSWSFVGIADRSCWRNLVIARSASIFRVNGPTSTRYQVPLLALIRAVRTAMFSSMSAARSFSASSKDRNEAA